MPLGWEQLVLIAAITCASAVIGGIGGFGTGIILTAALTPIIGIKAVVPVLAVAGLAMLFMALQ